MTDQLKSYCTRVKLKPNSIPRVREWAAELNSRRDEAFETLKDEGVFIESAFLEQTTDGDFLIYYMRMESMEKAKAAVARSPHPIDAYHKQFKIDCWESTQQLELLVDFERTQSRLN